MKVSTFVAHPDGIGLIISHDDDTLLILDICHSITRETAEICIQSSVYSRGVRRSRCRQIPDQWSDP